jgi:type I restriction enzyme S subunit
MEKELPKGWVNTKLGVIAEWGSGGTPNRNEPKYYDGTIPWVKTGDLNDSIILEASEYITELGLKKSSAKLFPKGSIIVAMYGATIGKTAKLGIDATTNQACAVAIASKIVIPEFLHYFLKSEKQEFIDKGKGGAQPNISQTVIKEHPFPLPPLPEQQRIVAKLDMLFGHLDALKTRLERIPQLLKEFRQKVLTQAVTGKLTEEWREINSQYNAYDLLKNELNKRFEFWIENEKQEIELKGKRLSLSEIKKKYKEPIKPLNLSFQEPDSWVKCTWDQLSNWITYGFTRPMPHVDRGIPIITVTNVRGGIIEFDTAENTTKNAFDSLNPKDKPKFGDILITKDGATLGRSAIVRTEENFCIGQSVAVVWLRSTISDKNFLQFVIESSYIQDRIWEVARGMGMPHLSITDFRALTIGLPPLEEQQEIVRRIETLFAKADQIEAGYQKLKAKIDQLPQALLAKAFRGKLVEQLPSDGDARDLLEQIKRAKEGLEKGGKGKKMKVEDELRMVAEDGARYGKK